MTNEELGNLIYTNYKKILYNKRLTQRELAKMLNKQEGGLTIMCLNLKKGKLPSVRILNEIANALQVQINYFFRKWGVRMTLNELLKVLPKNFYFELKGKNKEKRIDNKWWYKINCGF